MPPRDSHDTTSTYHHHHRSSDDKRMDAKAKEPHGQDQQDRHPLLHQHKHDHDHEVVIVVDPYSTGCLVVKEIMDRGYHVMCLYSHDLADDMKAHVPELAGDLDYVATIELSSDSLVETAERCRAVAKAESKTIVACVVGGENGVKLTDALSEHLGLTTNGTQVPNRRDKSVQANLVRTAGLRAVREASGSHFEQVEDFLRTEQYPVVLKPSESAGSDGVKLCASFEEAQAHFDILMQSQLVNGGACPAVLCQEFLRGEEYIVDMTSCGGVHKLNMIAKYDKRPANGAAFVYFGATPIDLRSKEAQVILPYARGVLDAIGIRHGATHGEVMLNEAMDPCLVEVNCRADGGNGNWHPLYKTMAGGVTQIEMTADAYLDPQRFDEYPMEPSMPWKTSGQEVHLVSYQEGIIQATPGYDVIRQLNSFVHMESTLQVGDTVALTTDLISNVGDVVLMNDNAKELLEDLHVIRTLESEQKLFVLEPAE